MDFSFEDFNDVVGGEVGDNDASQDVIEINEANEVIDQLFAQCEKVETVCFNYLKTSEAFKKNGATKANLHLLNKGNKLARAIGMSIPTYESDEELSGDEVEIDIEIATESIKSRLVTIKDAIVAFFKKIAQVIKDFFKKYFGFIARLIKRLDKIKSNIISKTKDADRQKFDAQTATTYPYDTFKKMLDIASGEKIVKVFNKIMDAKDDLTNEFSALGNVMIKANTDNLKFIFERVIDKVESIANSVVIDVKSLGKDIMSFACVELEIDKDISPDYLSVTFKLNPIAKEFEKERDTYGKLGWGVNAVEKMFPTIKELAKDLQKIDQLASKSTNNEYKLIKHIEKVLKDDGVPIALIDIILIHIQRLIRLATQFVKRFATEAYFLCVAYCGIAESIKIKG